MGVATDSQGMAVTCKYKWLGGDIILAAHTPALTGRAVKCGQCGKPLKILTDSYTTLTWIVPIVLKEWP